MPCFYPQRLLDVRNQEQTDAVYAGLEEVDVRIIEETNEDIAALEDELAHLHEAFVDVSSLIEEQREILVDTEAHTKQANIQAAEATDELRQGSVYQNKARKKMILIIVLVIVVLAGIGGALAAIAG